MTPTSARVWHALRDPPPPKFGQTAVAFPPSYRSGLSPRRERGPVYGERTMVRLVLHILLYSCTLAFVTGVVIAAAKFII
jgi:hypothetical protein